MEKTIQNILYTIAVAFLCSASVFANGSVSGPIKNIHNSKRNPISPNERPILYPKSILTNKFDFQVDAVSKGQFTVQFLNNTPGKFIGIKVYDVIGNLLLSENVLVNPQTQFLKQYDLSSSKSGVFIIEVGNKQTNKIKSVMAAGS